MKNDDNFVKTLIMAEMPTSPNFAESYRFSRLIYTLKFQTTVMFNMVPDKPVGYK